ncbi:uncharacterized protein [Malus domestica]|uniref:uncharacterized protein n=1 Tax=Malus domestica TaxID=3750 RepID=UPI0039769FA8
MAAAVDMRWSAGDCCDCRFPLLASSILITTLPTIELLLSISQNPKSSPPPKRLAKKPPTKVVYSDVYMMDGEMKWKVLPPLPKPGSHIEFACAVVHNSIVIVGGTTEKYPVTKRITLLVKYSSST